MDERQEDLYENIADNIEFVREVDRMTKEEILGVLKQLVEDYSE